MGQFKNYVTYRMAFFTSFYFDRKFYSITSPVLFPKLHKEVTEWDKRRSFTYMAASAYYVISSEVENQILDNWIFRHTCV